MKKSTVRIITGIMLAAAAAIIWQVCFRSTGGPSKELSDSTKNLAKEYQTQGDANQPDFIQPEVNLSDQSDYDFSKSYMDFSVSMLKKSQESNENRMISPLSIMLALTMTGNGARGETLAEMEAVLNGGYAMDVLNQELPGWVSGLPDSEKGRLCLANAIWVNNRDDSFTPDQGFLEKNGYYYNADIFSSDFGEKTLADINNWVEQRTEGMVKDILDKIPEEAVMYLINAVAFEAEWEVTYKGSDVRNGTFTDAEGTEHTVSMMYSTEQTYMEDASATGFIKPYAEGYLFAAILPNEGISLEEYMNQLDSEQLLQTIGQADDTISVTAGLPKHESESSLELSEALSAMGMPLAFNDKLADFSGLGRSTNGNIYISRVLHKTYINIDELGTKAAAATVVEVVAESAMMIDKTVILNRPFLYMILEEDSMLPIFMGTVHVPGESDTP